MPHTGRMSTCDLPCLTREVLHWCCVRQTAPSGAQAQGICNSAVPNTSNYLRFLYVIQVLVDNGFYVLIDNHLSLDDTATTNSSLCAASPCTVGGTLRRSKARNRQP